ncbi:MAG TPA: Crp/Fnr family transcriptional regulator [Flavobacterium sp.]|nr:Crp/Fnr family transcriptional regulator [Flavobacterium sp.]
MDIIANVSRHIDLDSEETNFFLSLLQQKTIKRKTYLLQEGDICRFESFVTKGCLKMYSVDKNGTEHVVMFAIEDWWVGDLYSFLSESPTTFYIEALEDTYILQISKPDLDKLYEKVPKFERFFRIMFQKAFIAQQQRINMNLSANAEERYLTFLKKFPHLEQRLPQKQIAAYLGMTPEMVSIIRRKMASRNS